jgi:hypothetical protein
MRTIMARYDWIFLAAMGTLPISAGALCVIVLGLYAHSKMHPAQSPSAAAAKTACMLLLFCARLMPRKAIFVKLKPK